MAGRGYDRHWKRLDAARRLLQVAVAAALITLLLAVVTGLVSLPLLIRIGSEPFAAVAFLAAAAGLVGLYRTMEFRCPRCVERFHLAGDLLFFLVFSRERCQKCGLRYGQLKRGS